MRLLHVVPTYLPARRYGGPIVAVHGLCKALAARGHQVDVFTTNVDGNLTLDVPKETPVELDGVRVHYFPSTFRRLYWSPSMGRALRDSSYDLLHLHSVYLWPTWAGARAARQARTPYVISPRGMLVPELIQQKSRLVKTAWLRTIERRNFAHAAAIHFTSRLEWEDAKRVGLPLPSPFVIPNGVELEARPAVSRDDATLVSLGRINWKKRLDAVIDALPSLPGLRYVIAGNDEENLTPALRELATRRGVADRVEFAGTVYDAAKWELLARAALLVMPSTSENFGNSVLEALSMETPVVVSPGVGLAASVSEAAAGAVAEPRELAPVIAGLLADRARRDEMGRNGRALVEERFGWARVAREMEEEYRRLCGSKTSPP